MHFLSREKVIYSIQALLLFLNISKEANSLSAGEVEKLRADSLELIEKLAQEQITGSKGAFELNTLIGKMNHFLTAPYPKLQTDSLENFVKGEIVAFEHYLNQELKASHLSLHQEGPLFNDSLNLWEQIGSSLSPQDGEEGLCDLVDKLNHFLPEEEHYPKPE